MCQQEQVEDDFGHAALAEQIAAASEELRRTVTLWGLRFKVTTRKRKTHGPTTCYQDRLLQTLQGGEGFESNRKHLLSRNTSSAGILAVLLCNFANDRNKHQATYEERGYVGLFIVCVRET